MSIMGEPMCAVAWPSASAPLPSVRLRRAPTTIGRNADIIPIRLAIEFAYAAGNDAAGRGPTGLAQLRHTSFARTSLRIRR
jgi:hypothetical protein